MFDPQDGTPSTMLLNSRCQFRCQQSSETSKLTPSCIGMVGSILESCSDVCLGHWKIRDARTREGERRVEPQTPPSEGKVASCAILYTTVRCCCVFSLPVRSVHSESCTHRRKIFPNHHWLPAPPNMGHLRDRLLAGRSCFSQLPGVTTNP